MKLKTLLLLISVSASSFAQKPQSVNDIFAPVIVGVPPTDAYVGLSKMDNGEIRHYNYGEQKVNDGTMYLSSRDSGLTWRAVSGVNELPFADVKSPVSGEYLRAFHSGNKVYILRTEGGINGGRTISQIDDTLAIMLKPVVFVEGGKRAIISGHRTDKSGCFTYVSTDDGKTWTKSNKINTPFHEKGGFHAGTRWNHGAVESTVTELNDGRLWMIMRTSQDKHYQSFSENGGLTWSEPTPSPFYGTITMPTFFRMADGRLLFFWCNTTPLPEMASATGVWDDVFTNRDATHVAISEDDGKTWTGFRELVLNDQRNDANFGTTKPGHDKSVHQAQAVEVAPGKILVSLGQNQDCRKMVIFDVNWLYETQRSEDFSKGLENLSAFRYHKGIVGHCCYNREEMPLLTQDPENPSQNLLNIKYTPTNKFVENNQGAVWNFPAAPNGELTMKIKLPEGSQNVNLILNDRWMNPTDTVAKYEGLYIAKLNRKDLKIKDNNWHTLTLKWTKNNSATLYIDNKKQTTIPAKNQTQHGASYLHLLGEQTPDNQGIYIQKIETKKIN